MTNRKRPEQPITSKRRQELSPGYRTKPIIDTPMHKTIINPPGGLAGIRMPNFVKRRRKAPDGHEILEINYAGTER